MVAKERCPLARLGDFGGLLENIENGKAVLGGKGHVHPRHKGKMEVHVAHVAIAEIGCGVFRPLVGLGKQHPVGIVLVNMPAHTPEELEGLRQVLAVGPLSLIEIGNSIEPKPVNAHTEPEVKHIKKRLVHFGVFKVEIRLMVVEPMPVVLPRHRIPGPVGGLKVLKDDAGLGIFVRVVAPYIEIPLGRAKRSLAGALEPCVLVGGMVDNKFCDNLQPAAVGLLKKLPEIVQRPIVGVDRHIVSNVVSIVTERRGVERKNPDGGDAETLQITELLTEPLEVADSIIVTVEERLDMSLVDNGVFVPERFGLIHGGVERVK